ncbi:MAG: thioesterase family protein [Chlamydiota bacterium]
MYRYKRAVRVRDTDATGVLYFAEQLQIGLEAFEDFLDFQRFSIGEMIEKNDYLLPIRHVEGDFFAPVYVGDILEVSLRFSKIGITSFTHASEFFKQGVKVGTVEITHVAYCPGRKKKIPIPDGVKNIFPT